MSSTDINWHALATSHMLSVHNIIDGEKFTCSGTGTITKHFSGDGRFLYEFANGTASDVDQAVQSASEAFEDGRWRNKTIYERAAILNKLADLVEENRQTFALLECLDVGKPVSMAYNGDVFTAAGNIRSAATNLENLIMPSGGEGGTFMYRTRKPVGVVGGIVGWNYPLCLAAQKVGPALAMGNSLVLKPSEFTPLSAVYLAELALEAGIPPGVFNVINGAGSTVGSRLTLHPDVHMLTFVGSSATGKQVMVAAGQSNMKRLLLECGGKSPYMVFDDCPEDLDWLARDIVVDTAFVNMGQICVSGSRVLIQESLRDKLLPKIIEQAQKLIPADPLDESTTFSGMMNQDHMQKVLDYINTAKADGATVLCGGEQVNLGSGGYFVAPTVLDNVAPDSTIAQEEVFGPVLSVITFKDEAEAIRIANNSSYGLAAYAATRDMGRAHRLGAKISSGIFIVVGTSTPSGSGVSIGLEAHKQSGMGMESGVEGLEAYSLATCVIQSY